MGVADKGRGAASGRSGGKIGGSTRRKKALASAVPSKVVSFYRKRKPRKQESAEMASPAGGSCGIECDYDAVSHHQPEIGGTDRGCRLRSGRGSASDSASNDQFSIPFVI